MALADRIRRAIVTRPRARDWVEAAVALAVLAVVGALASRTGLITFQPRPAAEIVRLAAIALFIPAIGEELLFRAPIPARGEGPGTAWITVSTLAFIAWHWLETVWLPGARTILLRPDFLALAGLLGLSCAILRRRSGSLWTAVIVHWFAVTAWLGWLGGPGVTSLR